MRKMATIRIIKDIQPISGADLIEMAQVDGWQLVVKKGEFSVDEPCVYCEIDSLLPADNPHFEFLAPRKYRIKTMKLRGQTSQGICFSTDILPDGDYKIGQDVSELLGIIKYEPPLPAQLAGKVKGYFPSFIPKTDQERCQNIPELLEEWAGKKLYVTEKLDGSSVTIYLNDGVYGVCSRNLELKVDDPDNFRNQFIKTTIELEMESKLQKLQDLLQCNLALQGELVGPGIQKNPLKLDEVTILFYNIWDIDSQRYIDARLLFYTLSAATIGLKCVPVVEFDFTLAHTVKDLVEYAAGPSLINPKVKREGVVFRAVDEEYVDRFGWLSFKAISSEYLLKHEG